MIVGGGSAVTNLHACALKTTGTYKGYLFCWGTGTNYEIDTGGATRTDPYKVPASPITGSDVWKDFAIGYNNTYAIDSQGNVLARGTSKNGDIFNTTAFD